MNAALAVAIFNYFSKPVFLIWDTLNMAFFHKQFSTEQEEDAGCSCRHLIFGTSPVPSELK